VRKTRTHGLKGGGWTRAARRRATPLAMTTFWLGAGAAAAVILAVLGVLQYARSGSNLLVSVRQYEFELPATAQQAFAKLAERISPWSDEPLAGIDDEVAGGVEAVLKVFGIRVGPRLRIFWKIMLRNRGREPAQAVELQVPEAVQIEVRRGSMGDGVAEEWVVLRDRAVIGEVRPGESVRVLAWGPRVSEEPSVTQRKGRASVRVLKMVRSRWVRLAQIELALLVLIVLYVVLRLTWLH